MNSTSKVYTPIIVKDPPPPIYRPPVVVQEVTSKSPPQVNDMYLTREETEEGTIWHLNIVSDNEQEYKYRLHVDWN
jgi:hypothetical protein